MVLKELRAFKELVQGTLDENDEHLHRYGSTSTPQLKTYLIESNRPKPSDFRLHGEWRPFPEAGWYASSDPQTKSEWVLDASHPRVWRLFSLSHSEHSDATVNDWLEAHDGLDYCWLTRPYMTAWAKREGWKQRGVGLRFEDGLLPEEDQGRFSLKAWYGASKRIPAMQDVLTRAQEEFAIHSTRWQKLSNGTPKMTVELYSSGKVTVNTAHDVDDALNFSQEVAIRYRTALDEAQKSRDSALAPFEFDFRQTIDLPAFAAKVAKAAAPMRLWLVPTERPRDDFWRFKGVDLHTWDRVYLDVAPSYAYLTIPGKGCVNAAPRLATLQGEDNAGRTEIFHDGVPVFA